MKVVPLTEVTQLRVCVLDNPIEALMWLNDLIEDILYKNGFTLKKGSLTVDPQGFVSFGCYLAIPKKEAPHGVEALPQSVIDAIVCEMEVADPDLTLLGSRVYLDHLRGDELPPLE